MTDEEKAKSMAAMAEAGIEPARYWATFGERLRAGATARIAIAIRQQIRDALGEEVSDAELDRLILEAIERDKAAEKGGKKG